MKTILALALALGVATVAADMPTFGKHGRVLTEQPDSRQFIVKFKDNESGIHTASARSNFISTHGAQGILDIPSHNMCAVRCANNAVRNSLRNDPNVEYVERDQPRYLYGLRGDRNLQAADPRFNWALEFAMQGEEPRVFDNPTTVCVVDSGLYTGHEDFQDALSNGRLTGVDTSASLPWDEDQCSHGTHVSGTIAADYNNGLGTSGMANLNIRTVRVFGNNCNWAYTSSLVAAMDVCVQDPDVSVISMSLGGGGSSNFERAAIEGYRASGVVVVAASGNSGSSGYSYPASYEAVVSVGAHDDDEDIASFSTFNDRVDIAAPGVSVLSTTYNAAGNGYSFYSGTSMATPHVSACAGILKSMYPSATPDQIEDALTSAAKDDSDNAGYDNFFGAGMLQCKDAWEALGLVVTPPTPPAPVTNPTAITTGPYAASVSWTHPGTDVTAFEVTATADSTTFSVQSVASGARSASVTDLPPSASITFTVVALNGNSPSENNPTSNAIMTAPAPPSGITISGETTSSLTVSWTQEAGTTYTLLRDATELSTSAASPYTDTGLATDTEYMYTLRATANSMTSGDATVTGTTLPDPPADVDEATFTATEVTGSSVSLTWDAVPGADSYTVTRSPSSTLATINTPTNSLVDDTVEPDTAYTYSVTAVNRGGSSANAATLDVTTPEVCVERDPTLDFATPVNVDCSAPGGSTTVSVDLVNADTSVCDDDEFSMAASPSEEDADDITVSFADGNDLETGEPSELRIRFKSDNYPSESELTLTNTGTGEVLFSFTPDESQKTYTFFETLFPGNEYEFKLTDSYGDGVCCSYGRGYIRLDLNGDRIFIDRTFDHETSKIIGEDYLGETSTGGSFIDEQALAPGASHPRDLTITIPEAHDPSETFTVRLFATRGEFEGAEDADTEAVLHVMCALPDPPVAPTAVTAALGSPSYSTIVASWEHTGDAATTFNVEYKAMADAEWLAASGSPFSASPATISGLAPETEYEVRVSALLNAQTTEPVKGDAPVTTTTAPPAAVTNLQAVASAAGVSLTWDLGAVAGNAPDTHIISRGNTELEADAGATTVQYDDTAAADDMEYTYTVTATNAAGSADATVTVTTQPGAPTGSAAAGTPSWSVLTVTWAPASATGTHAGFSVEIRTGSDAYAAVAGSPFGAADTTTDITGLARNTQYDIRVTALNGELASDALELSASTTEAPPGAPSKPTATANTGTNVDLEWTLAAIDNNAPTAITLERFLNGALDDTFTLDIDAESYSDTGVSPETTYTYIVKAANDFGVAASEESDDIVTPPICERGDPEIQLSIAQTEDKPADSECSKSITFLLSFTITNRDSEVCGASTMTVAPVLPADFEQCNALTTTTTPGADLDEFSFELRAGTERTGDLLDFGQRDASGDAVVCGETDATAFLLDSAADGMPGGRFEIFVDGADTATATVDTSPAFAVLSETVALSTSRSASILPGGEATLRVLVRTTGISTPGGSFEVRASVENEDSARTGGTAATTSVQCQASP